MSPVTSTSAVAPGKRALLLQRPVGPVDPYRDRLAERLGQVHSQSDGLLLGGGGEEDLVAALGNPLLVAPEHLDLLHVGSITPEQR